eukprot:2116355-Rhodomonas_salina.1
MPGMYGLTVWLKARSHSFRSLRLQKVALNSRSSRCWYSCQMSRVDALHASRCPNDTSPEGSNTFSDVIGVDGGAARGCGLRGLGVGAVQGGGAVDVDAEGARALVGVVGQEGGRLGPRQRDVVPLEVAVDVDACGAGAGAQQQDLQVLRVVHLQLDPLLLRNVLHHRLARPRRVQALDPEHDREGRFWEDLDWARHEIVDPVKPQRGPGSAH